MDINDYNSLLLSYLAASPSPFHATAGLRLGLTNAGFTELAEAEPWSVEPGRGYYVVRNDSSIVAFRAGTAPLEEAGLRMVGAHTDSPCLRLKPNAMKRQNGYDQFGVEVYGGVLLNPWFDRDLSMAGRVTLRGADGRIRNRLVDFLRPIAFVPSLAIHLDRDANTGRTVNPQTMLPPIVGLGSVDPLDLNALLLEELGEEGEVLQFELSLYDTQPPAMVGLSGEFIASARLDNLLSCFVALAALTGAAPTAATQLMVCNDHEEVGSGSTSGARGNLLESVIQRLSGSAEAYGRAMSRSFLLSTDNAHGVHPNFADRHEPEHRPMLNAGPVLKVNANQAYATSSETAGVIEALARDEDIPLQRFVTRTDLGCGSTIGPLTATRLGVRTLDIGVPTFAMHSIRELAGRDDAQSLTRLSRLLFESEDLSVLPA